MKITKQRLRKTIKEELEKKLVKENQKNLEALEDAVQTFSSLLAEQDPPPEVKQAYITLRNFINDRLAGT